MKKIIAILSAAALALTLSTGVFAAENVALTGTGFNSNPDTTNTGDKLVDGDLGTYAGSTANDATMANGEYVGVTLDGLYNIETVVLHWGGGHPDADGFKVELSQDGNTWNEVTPAISREDVDITHYNDTLTFAAGTTAKAIRVTTTKAMGKNSLQCWEIEVFGTAAANDDDNTNVPGGDVDTGVESVMIWAVIAMAATAVVFTAKKVRA